MTKRNWIPLALLAPAVIVPAVIAGCTSSTNYGSGAVALDSTTRRGQGEMMAAGVPNISPTAAPPTMLPSFPGAYVPPRFAGAAVTGQLTFIFDGDVAGQSNNIFVPGATNVCGEPLLAAIQSVLLEGGQRLSDGTTLLSDGSIFTTGGAPNPALLAGRDNIDVDLLLSGLPTPGVSEGGTPDTVHTADRPTTIPDQLHTTGGVLLPPTIGYAVDVPDAQAMADEMNNPLYWARTSAAPDPRDNAIATDNRPFRVNHVSNGWLQAWLIAEAPRAATVTAPGPAIGTDQNFVLYYRRRADAGGPAGSLRGFNTPAGAAPPGVLPDDIRVQLPGPNPLVDAAGNHLTGQVPGILRVIGLPPFRPNTNGTAHVRSYVIGERATDQAITGGFEVVFAPRAGGVTANGALIAPDPATGLPNFQVILVRTVPASEDFSPELSQAFLTGAQTWGIAITLEPPANSSGSVETGIDLALRNTIEVAAFRPQTAFDFNTAISSIADPCLNSSNGLVNTLTQQQTGTTTGGTTGTTTAGTTTGTTTAGTTTGTTTAGTTTGTGVTGAGRFRHR